MPRGDKLVQQEAPPGLLSGPSARDKVVGAVRDDGTIHFLRAGFEAACQCRSGRAGDSAIDLRVAPGGRLGRLHDASV